MVTKRKYQSTSEGLETTLSALDIRTEAAAHVSAMRRVAEEMDRCFDPDKLAKLGGLFMRQLIELREWVAPPEIEEDPFDVLARKLSAGAE